MLKENLTRYLIYSHIYVINNNYDSNNSAEITMNIWSRMLLQWWMALNGTMFNPVWRPVALLQTLKRTNDKKDGSSAGSDVPKLRVTWSNRLENTVDKYSFTVIMRVPHSCKGNLQHFMWKRLGHTGWMAMCVGPRNFAHHFGTLWRGPRGLLHTWWAVSVIEEVDHPAVILKVEGSRPQGNHGVRSRDPSWQKKSVVVVWLEMSHQ